MASHHPNDGKAIPLHRAVPERSNVRPLDHDLAERMFAGPVEFVELRRPSEERPDLYRMLRLRQQRREADRDWRIIGYGLLAGYAFVCIARAAQLGWL